MRSRQRQPAWACNPLLIQAPAAHGADYRGYSDHRPDLTLLLDGNLTVFDLKVFNPIGSRADTCKLRGG